MAHPVEGGSQGAKHQRNFLKRFAEGVWEVGEATGEFQGKVGGNIIKDIPFAVKNAFGAGEASSPGGSSGGGKSHAPKH